MHFSFYRPSKVSVIQKQSLWVHSGWFFMGYFLKWDPICTKFLPVMQCNVTYHICTVFSVILKTPRKSAKKLIFWLILRGFSFTHSYVLWVPVQSFVKLKALWRYIIVESFIYITFIAVELKMFIVFPADSASMTWTFSSPYSPKYCPILLKFSTKVAFKERKTLLWQSLKKSNFYGNGTYLEFALLLRLWPPVSPWRWPKLGEIKCLLQKISSIGLYKYVKTKSLSLLSLK